MKKSGELHHIKPKSLFPDLKNDKSNIVKLTYREHYVCHHLLFKIYEEKDDTNASCKMAHAWFRTCKNTDGLHINSYLFEKAKLKGKFPCSEKTKELLRTINIGRKLSEEQKQKISNSLLGIRRSEETKKRMSEAQKGKIFSKETREKISATLKEGKGGKGYHWWTNGEINKHSNECPR